jgi:hypothetical protein
VPSVRYVMKGNCIAPIVSSRVGGCQFLVRRRWRRGDARVRKAGRNVGPVRPHCAVSQAHNLHNRRSAAFRLQKYANPSSKWREATATPNRPFLQPESCAPSLSGISRQISTDSDGLQIRATLWSPRGMVLLFHADWGTGGRFGPQMVVIKHKTLRTGPRRYVIVQLARSSFGRILLHLACACLDRRYRWHWLGIRRELGA